MQLHLPTERRHLVSLLRGRLNDRPFTSFESMQTAWRNYRQAVDALRPDGTSAAGWRTHQNELLGKAIIAALGKIFEEG